MACSMGLGVLPGAIMPSSRSRIFQRYGAVVSML